MKCPFCETELEQMHDKKLLGCPKCLHIADGALWAKVIQSQKDLEESQQATLENAQTVLEIHKDLQAAKLALDWVYKNYYLRAYAKGLVEKALEQIEHKE